MDFIIFHSLFTEINLLQGDTAPLSKKLKILVTIMNVSDWYNYKSQIFRKEILQIFNLFARMSL